MSSLSSPKSSIPEYELVKYLDSHLALKVLDFHIERSADKEAVLRYKKNVLQSTLLFSDLEKFLNENKNLQDGTEAEFIEKKKEQLVKKEDETKFLIRGFLNLMENFRKSNNFDTSSSMHKKIVK